MDTFFEQIISIKKTGKTVAAIIGIWFAAFILCAILYLFPILGSINLLLIVGVLYGAFKLSTLLNIEYEYIITNGTMDVDKIINKSNRKRMLSFELGNVSRLEKYNAGVLNSINPKSVVFACDENDPNAYFLVAEKDGKGTSYLVFSPDERIKEAAAKFIPKFIVNSAFK
jgi:hypothetical protein